MHHDDHEEFHDPSSPRGLPGPLPPGEELLWQGAPNWRGLAIRALHVRIVFLYFVIVFLYGVASNMYAGTPMVDALSDAMPIIVPAAFVLGLMYLYSFLACRAAVYTITSARVCIHLGIMLPRTVNLPFKRFDNVNLKLYGDGSGDINIMISRKARLAYLALWPHVRPWRVKFAEPMLRCVPDAQEAADILVEALRKYHLANPLEATPASAESKDPSPDDGSAPANVSTERQQVA